MFQDGVASLLVERLGRRWGWVARELDVALVSADKRLLASGLADSPTATAARLRLGGSGGRKP
jgi:hypothetical protein